ncbi:condensation domain-containing protein [Nocardia mangyaensis]|uniref:condensation domain-containing protein n=1 Tax=Nocardia mangyaensis TaxID=2213200 RepID=UPI00267729A9|nr:condensation domain-containing protein [Nocardia mangyaensis]MDO3647327.1 condensation domain-containing protein [Nocardia mangyaensis]
MIDSGREETVAVARPVDRVPYEGIWSDSAEEAAQLERWCSALAGLRANTGPATDLTRPDRPGSDGHIDRFSISASLRNRLRDVAAAAGAAEFLLYQAAALTLLHKLGGGTEPVLAAVVAGRVDAIAAAVVSPSAKTVLSRTDLSGSPSLRAVLDQVRATSLARTGDRDVATDLTSGADRYAAVLYFDDRDRRAEPPFGDERAATTTASELDGARSDLAFAFVGSRDGGLAASITLNADLYHRGTAQLFAHRMLRVLHAFADTPDLPLSDLDVMPPEERRRVLDEWSCGVEVSEVFPLPDLLRRARTYPPTRTAIRAGADTVDFGTLCDRLASCATHPIDPPSGGPLGSLSEVPRTPVAVARPEVSHAVVPASIVIDDLLTLVERFVAADGAGAPLEIVDDAGALLSFEPDAIAAAVADRRAVAASRQVGRVDPACRMADNRVIVAGAGTLALLVEALAAMADGATLELVPRGLAPGMSARTTHVVADVADLLTEPGNPTRLVDLPAVAADGAPQRWDLLSRDGLRIAVPGHVTGTIGYAVPGYAGAVARGPLDGSGRVRPVPGARVLVLDDAGRPTAPGVVGEVFVGGTGLGKTSPSDPDRGGTDGLVRTGDRARWTTAGWLVFADPDAPASW